MSIIFDDDTSHYQHGIPGIPTDGKVVLLKNSKFKSEVYLVGTNHISKKSAETVKKVINYVRPNAVAMELCAQYADILNSETEHLSKFEMFLYHIRAPWDLPMKIDKFVNDCWYYQLRAKGILKNLEFKVATEEASRMRARCFPIDQDTDVTDEKLSKVYSWGVLWNFLLHDVYKYYRSNKNRATESTRAFARERCTNLKKQYPEYFKVLIDDRDKFMFEKIRTIRKKVVVVVGMGHMDGIELLWKQAEEDMLQRKKNAEEGDNKRPLSSKKKKKTKQ